MLAFKKKAQVEKDEWYDVMKKRKAEEETELRVFAWKKRNILS